MGTELKGMVLSGCIAPYEWPPSPAELDSIATSFDVSRELMAQHVTDVYYLDDVQRERVLAVLPRIATLIAHIVDGRRILVDMLDAIASLSHW